MRACRRGNGQPKRQFRFQNSFIISSQLGFKSVLIDLAAGQSSLARRPESKMSLGRDLEALGESLRVRNGTKRPKRRMNDDFHLGVT